MESFVQKEEYLKARVLTRNPMLITKIANKMKAKARLGFSVKVLRFIKNTIFK